MMKKVTGLKLGGVLLGSLMILGSFFRWTVYTGVGAGASWRVFKFLGLDIYSSDKLVGLNSFPVIAGAVFILSVLLSDRSIYVVIFAGFVSGLSFLLTAYNLIYWKFYPFPPDRWVEIHVGLCLTLTASMLALVLVFLIRKSVLPRTG